jgi:hypothetical protein
MASTDYIPKTDQGKLAFTQNFRDRIENRPEVFGLNIDDAAAYVVAQDLYAQKLAAAVEPMTRGRRTVFEKDQARKSIVRLTRRYAQQITKRMQTTDEMRQELGIPIPTGQRRPANVPGFSPEVVVTKTAGRTATVALRRPDGKRSRPAGVSGATIFYHVGEAPPASVDGWVFAANTTKMTVEIPFPPSATGGKVWLTAFYTNSVDASGPAAEPISVNLPAGGVLPSEVETPMRRAA